MGYYNGQNVQEAGLEFYRGRQTGESLRKGGDGSHLGVCDSKVVFWPFMENRKGGRKHSNCLCFSKTQGSDEVQHYQDNDNCSREMSIIHSEQFKAKHKLPELDESRSKK